MIIGKKFHYAGVFRIVSGMRISFTESYIKLALLN